MFDFNIQKHQTRNLFKSANDCTNCRMQKMCLTRDLNNAELDKFMQIVQFNRKVNKGKTLYRTGDPLTSLYVIKLGHFKSTQVNNNGEIRVIGFPMSGDLMGLDSLNSRTFNSDLTALEDSIVCQISYEHINAMFNATPTLRDRFNCIMSEEIYLDKTFMFLLSNAHADQRVANFILDLSEKFSDRGYSKSIFLLRMSRIDISNFLGLTGESISRILMRFHKDKVISVDKREISILDMEKLENMANGNMSVISKSNQITYKSASS